MTVATYTAERSLAAGDSLDGSNVETIVLRRKRVWSITTATIAGGSELDLYLEFLESVSEGEDFTFDEFGTAADQLAGSNQLPPVP